MATFTIMITTILGSFLTFFSGFGLGTILLPVFLLFFELKIAILSTAIVHFANSIFKFIFLKKYISVKLFVTFGLPAIIGASIGSFLISFIDEKKLLYTYEFYEKKHEIYLVDFLIGTLIFLFTVFELLNFKSIKLKSSNKILTLGGVISGFFGGLSGHQGALRSMFLKNIELSKETFIATSTSISLVIDFVRISIYLLTFDFLKHISLNQFQIIFTGIVGAFIGAVIGKKILSKITHKLMQLFISCFLIIFSLLLMFGFI